MKLKEKTAQELIEIMKQDYGVSLNAEQAEQLGCSLLRLTKIARGVFSKNIQNKVSKKV